MPAPRNAKQPQDYKKAAKAEATGQPVEVEYNGATYTVDEDAFSDMHFLDLIGNLNDAEKDKDHIAAVRAMRVMVVNLLGEEQYADFEKANTNAKGRFDVSHIKGLFETLDAAVGNQRASSGS